MTNRWRVPDRRYRSGYRWTPEARTAIRKWSLIGVVYVILWALLAVSQDLPLILLATIVIAVYAFRRISVNVKISNQARQPPHMFQPTTLTFNPPPGWPQAPPGWSP